MKKLQVVSLVAGLLILLFTTLLFFSCQKDVSSSAPPGKQRVSIRLSDGPVNFDAVYVNIQRVEVLVLADSCRGRGDDDDHETGCSHDRDGDHDRHQYQCASWDTLSIRPGIYDLLHLSNGRDTLLASGFIAAGRILKIRLTLGPGNSVLIDSVSYPLLLWNNMNRVTISLRGDEVEQLSPGDVQVWLDFDAGLSIVRLFNNHFVLKPFLRVWLPSRTAAVRGQVLPDRADAVVSAIANGDTLVAFPREEGMFLIRGLTGNSADVYINATSAGYRDTVLTGVGLHAGQVTDIGTIRLHQ